MCAVASQFQKMVYCLSFILLIPANRERRRCSGLKSSVIRITVVIQYKFHHHQHPLHLYQFIPIVDNTSLYTYYQLEHKPLAVDQLSTIILENKPYLIGIAGIPGSGKTTTANKLKAKLPNSIVLPMDGFHFYRKDLNQQGMLRRGAAFTFDHTRFRNMLEDLKKNRQGSFPDFDHAQKDPKQNAILITPNHQHIIVQGLYLFYPEWKVLDLFDFKIWMECPIELAVDRVAKRHYQCGIQPTMEKSIERANNNDRRNAIQIIQNSRKEGCTVCSGY